ncbi:MAG: M3 family oligoendopeptidase [Lachnospiraceae bacterium]|nr:M3 family oligoendopeptidase [Lachnospiraceae bacterium]
MKFSEMPYEHIDFDAAIERIKELAGELKKASSAEEQFEVHKKFYKLHGHIKTMQVLAEIRHSIDTTDPFYKKEQDYLDQEMPRYKNAIMIYDKELFESPYREGLEKIIGPVAFKNIECELKSTDERLIPLMQEENRLVTEYEALLSSAKIPWNGEILNLSLMRPYKISPDRNVRKKANEAYWAFFKENAEKLDDLYDQLVKNRDKQAKMLGYDNYIPLGYYRMMRNDYGREQVEAFRRQVKKCYVPFAESLHEKRRQRLGLDHLYYYDEQLYFKEGNPAPDGTPDEILQGGLKMYQELSPETKEFMEFMMENELFDVLGKKNKRSGGFMEYLPEFHSSFVFANFNGTSGDIDVITHECGHAFQGHISGKDPIMEHSDITMETAEIHSMSMEFFTEPWMDSFFGERADQYRQMHLEDSIIFIPYGCMVDEFQHIVYEHPEYTPAQRKAAWRELEKQYKPHLDYEGDPFLEAGGYWQFQHHIYSLPFYYIDYCLAQSCALEYKGWMDENREEAWKSYLKLCSLSASDFYTGLLKQVGLSCPFEDGYMEKLVARLAKA